MGDLNFFHFFNFYLFFSLNYVFFSEIGTRECVFFLNKKKVILWIAAMTLLYLNCEYMLVRDQNFRRMSSGLVFFFIFMLEQCHIPVWDHTIII